MLTNLKKYLRPKTITEALTLLEKNSGSILVIAGGTKLVRSQNDTVQELVDITALNLDYIKNEQGLIRIGATTTLQKLIASPEIKHQPLAIIEAAARLTQPSKTIRNVSTLGGELITSHSLSLLYCALLVLQAQVRITGGEEFALAMNIFLNKKDLAGGLLMEVLIPINRDPTFAGLAAFAIGQPPQPAIAACARVSFQKGRCINAKIAITGTNNVPQRLHIAENCLEDKALTDANIELAAGNVYDIYQPISDELASAEYRKEVSRLVIKKALLNCLENVELHG
ncbi:MAG: FAD binding domain-containing protein [bacterium]